MAVAEDFDRPLFKVLSHNDSGQAVGHQAGFVIPKDLEPYFPQLSQNVTAAAPTVSVDIAASLFDGTIYLGDVSARYQYQTWGGTRSPERRLTNNLTALRNLAQKDDILLIERGLRDQNRYRLTLVRQTNQNYAALFNSLGGKRWGPLDPRSPPVKETAVLQALGEQVQHEAAPFQPFDHAASTVEQRTTRIARSRAFQRRLVELYGARCAICAQALTRTDGRTESEAAHIIPRSVKGSDDARNGLLLCRAHHWAFDNGLIAISDGLAVIVPATTTAIPANASLGQLAGVPLAVPTDANMRPHADAIIWHRDHFGIQ
jgi:putative restriction endonuclease